MLFQVLKFYETTSPKHKIEIENFKNSTLLRYNKYSVVQPIPGLAICRIRKSQIYGWIYGEDSPCFAHDDFSFARILQRNSEEIEGKYLISFL